MTFSIMPPTIMKNVFGNWLYGFNKQDKVHIQLGACDIF
jgi:hypothetical protein